jgi:hypothetical protein
MLPMLPRCVQTLSNALPPARPLNGVLVVEPASVVLYQGPSFTQPIFSLIAQCVGRGSTASGFKTRLKPTRKTHSQGAGRERLQPSLLQHEHRDPSGRPDNDPLPRAPLASGPLDPLDPP